MTNSMNTIDIRASSELCGQQMELSCGHHTGGIPSLHWIYLQFLCDRESDRSATDLQLYSRYYETLYVTLYCYTQFAYTHKSQGHSLTWR